MVCLVHSFSTIIHVWPVLFTSISSGKDSFNLSIPHFRLGHSIVFSFPFVKSQPWMASSLAVPSTWNLSFYSLNSLKTQSSSTGFSSTVTTWLNFSVHVSGTLWSPGGPCRNEAGEGGTCGKNQCMFISLSILGLSARSLQRKWDWTIVPNSFEIYCRGTLLSRNLHKDFMFLLWSSMISSELALCIGPATFRRLFPEWASFLYTWRCINQCHPSLKWSSIRSCCGRLNRGEACLYCTKLHQQGAHRLCCPACVYDLKHLYRVRWAAEFAEGVAALRAIRQRHNDVGGG